MALSTASAMVSSDVSMQTAPEAGRSGASARSVSRASRARTSARTAFVACRVAGVDKLFQAPFSPAFGTGGDEQLRLGLGADHRADVAPVQHRTPGSAGRRRAGSPPVPRALAESRPPCWPPVPPRACAGPRPPDPPPAAPGPPRSGPRLQAHACQRPCKATPYQGGPAEMRRNRPGHRALAGGCRAVDGDGETHGWGLLRCQIKTSTTR